MNLAFTLLEIVGGFYTNSMMILSDALHDLGDSLSLGMAWYFQALSQKKGDNTFSYGYGRFSILGALVNSLVLILGSIYILIEVIPRLMNPEPADTPWMIVLAILGIIVNGAAVFRLRKGDSINEEVISLHLLEDVLGWVAVLIASIVMHFTDFPIIDPILSILITGYVLFNVFRNLWKSLRIFLQATPENMNLEEIKAKILEMPKVCGIHKFHLWTLDGNYNVLSIHIEVAETDSLAEVGQIKSSVKNFLKDLDIEHITIEVEKEGEACG